jgi:hypothetical protein
VREKFKKAVERNAMDLKREFRLHTHTLLFQSPVSLCLLIPPYIYNQEECLPIGPVRRNSSIREREGERELFMAVKLS